MKKIFSFIMTMVCLLIFSGCGQSSHDTQNYETQQIIVTDAVTEAVTDAYDEVTISVSDDEGSDTADTGEPPEETEEIIQEITQSPPPQEEVPDENGTYTSRDEVALYIHTYGRLPDNFISKKEAEKLGWSGGSLEPYAPGKCIGGSRFGNYEGILPDKDGRTYTECDIDTLGAKKRGAKRIVFSNDGLIYYTEDHYESFELLYGDEE